MVKFSKGNGTAEILADFAAAGAGNLARSQQTTYTPRLTCLQELIIRMPNTTVLGNISIGVRQKKKLPAHKKSDRYNGNCRRHSASV
jgi:hypothetical protein